MVGDKIRNIAGVRPSYCCEVHYMTFEFYLNEMESHWKFWVEFIYKVLFINLFIKLIFTLTARKEAIGKQPSTETEAEGRAE